MIHGLSEDFVGILLGVFMVAVQVSVVLILKLFLMMFSSQSLRRLENDLYRLTHNPLDEKNPDDGPLVFDFKGKSVKISYEVLKKPADFEYSFGGLSIVRILFNSNFVGQLVVIEGESLFKRRKLFLNKKFDTTDFWSIIKAAREASNEKLKEFHRIRHEKESKLPKPY